MAYTTINKSSEHFNTKLTTGTGSSQAVTGVGFQPDLIWGKRRDGTGNHSLFDAVRGITKGLETNGTGSEYTSTDYYSSFDSDGFTIAAGSGGAGNGSSQTAVQWCWKANGTGSANTAGSINSTVSANTTSGFSIVSYTGNGNGNSTIGHGLGATPKFIIVKRRSSAQDWGTYSPSFVSASDPNIVYLSKNTAQADDTNVWGTSATFNNNTFTVGDWTGSNSNGDTFIAYCFAEKTGFSKFGKYIGTGSTTGTPFIYTGFKPAFVMTKGADVADAWTISDIPRDNDVGGGNGTGARVTANESAGESTNTSWASIQKYSNGFSPQGNDGVTNQSGGTYIYMAFAEAPLVGSNGVTAKAR
ncbi:hypothetical protein N9J64_00370 [bacterium]|nr:hypothetical protein [bacterium]